MPLRESGTRRTSCAEYEQQRVGGGGWLVLRGGLPVCLATTASATTSRRRRSRTCRGEGGGRRPVIWGRQGAAMAVHTPATGRQFLDRVYRHRGARGEGRPGPDGLPYPTTPLDGRQSAVAILFGMSGGYVHVLSSTPASCATWSWRRWTRSRSQRAPRWWPRRRGTATSAMFRCEPRARETPADGPAGEVSRSKEICSGSCDEKLAALSSFEMLHFVQHDSFMQTLTWNT